MPMKIFFSQLKYFVFVEKVNLFNFAIKAIYIYLYEIGGFKASKKTSEFGTCYSYLKGTSQKGHILSKTKKAIYFLAIACKVWTFLCPAHECGRIMHVVLPLSVRSNCG